MQVRKIDSVLKSDFADSTKRSLINANTPPCRQCSLGFEKKSFSADSDLIIKSGIADSMPGSFDILRLDKTNI